MGLVLNTIASIATVNTTDSAIFTFDDGAALTPEVESQQRKKLVVERYRDVQVLHRDLYMVNEPMPLGFPIEPCRDSGNTHD